MVRENLHTLFT